MTPGALPLFGLRLFLRRGKIGCRNPAGLDAGLHDQCRPPRAKHPLRRGIGTRGLAVLALAPADQVVGGAVSKILDRLYFVLAERTSSLVVMPGTSSCGPRPRVRRAALRARPPPFEIFARPGLQFAGGLFVEAFDPGDFPFVDLCEIFDRAKASDASNWPTTSSTFSASMKTRVEFSKSA